MSQSAKYRAIAAFMLITALIAANSAVAQEFHVTADRVIYDASNGEPIPRPTFTLTIVNDDESPNSIRWQGTESAQAEYYDTLGRFWPPFRAGDWIEIPPRSEYRLFVYSLTYAIRLDFWAVADSAFRDSVELTIYFPVNVRDYQGDNIVRDQALQAFPNPFNSSTTISYTLPNTGWTTLDVVDLNGRLVTRLADGWKEAGSYREVWNCGRLTTGLYFAKLESHGQIRMAKLMLVR